MATIGVFESGRHLRRRDGGEQKTTTIELFFDCVYVFAVTQLSHLVLNEHLSAASIGRAAFLLIVVWWAWVYTTWMVNWFDPASAAVRFVIAAVALASLLMSSAIPDAFGARGVLFAASYVGMQVGRNCCATLFLSRDHALRRVFERLTVWSLVSGTIWLAGGFAHGAARYELWAVALVVELAAPLVGYRVPGLGRSSTADWPVEGGHFAERFQSFIIIALGESIVITGATATSKGLSELGVIAMAVAFLITATLWWLYFGEVAEGSRRTIAEAEDPGRLARDAYTYLHLPIVAGIIMVAIGDDLLIAHPDMTLSATAVALTVLGPVIYLAGESLVRLRMIGRISAKRAVAMLALLVLGVAGRNLSALALSSAIAAVLLALAAVEHESLRAAVVTRRLPG